MLFLRLFGGAALEADGSPLTGRATQKRRIALLALLATASRRCLTRDKIIGYLWPEHDTEQARHLLSVALYELRKALGDEVITARSDEVRLDVSLVPSDVAEFDEALAARELERAVALYSGPFMDGVFVSDAPEFERWMAVERERYARAYCQVLEALAHEQAARGEERAAVEVWRRLVAEDPFNTRLTVGLMRALERVGDRAGALQHARVHALLLREEFGAEPDPEVEVLAERLRSEPVPAAAPPREAEAISGTGLPNASAGRDRGAAPDLPPINNLPSQPTAFVGREEELQDLAKLLAASTCRLLTVCGPGGIGKTRLALQAAHENAHAFLHGVCFVPLSGLSAADPLIPTIAAQLQLALSSREDPKLQLLDYLRGKQLLLGMDNFEHLTASAVLLSEILEQAPQVKIITTSRERLNLHGETLFPLDGLRSPPSEAVEDAARFDAIQLFLQTAQRVQPRFSLSDKEIASVIRICHLIEGVPLAIELAAAWVRMLTCAEIEREIEQNRDFLSSSARDVPERHRSLRAVFESTWRLLSEEEKAVCRRFSVFRGGFHREAAETVAGASLHLLSSLIDKSLLRRASSGRFEILEVVRQHAEERLGSDPQEQARINEQHCDYFTNFMNALRPQLQGAEEKSSLELVEKEIENIRAAWRWAVQEKRADRIAKALDGLFAFYEARGWAREGEEMFGAAAAVAVRNMGAAGADPEASLVYAKLAVRQAVFSSDLGLGVRARELLENALVHLRDLDQAEELAFALDQLGILLVKAGEYQAARERYTESAAIYRTLQDPRGTGRTQTHLGTVAFALGDYASAARSHEEGLTLLEEAGDHRGMSLCLINLGIVAGVTGNLADAKQFFRRGLEIYRTLGNLKGIAYSLQNLGVLAWMAGEYAEADEALQETAAICRAIGFRRLLALCLNTQGHVATARGESQAAEELYSQGLATAREIGETPTMLAIMRGIARLLGYHEAGRTRAVELLSLVLHHPASDQETKDEATSALDALRSEIPPTDVEAALERGKSLDLESVVSEILGSRAAVGAG